MRYKVMATTPSEETAQILFDTIRASKVYGSAEHIIVLLPIKEVCDECASK